MDNNLRETLNRLKANKICYISENVSKLFFIDSHLYELVKSNSNDENFLDSEGTLNWEKLTEEVMIREGRKLHKNCNCSVDDSPIIVKYLLKNEAKESNFFEDDEYYTITKKKLLHACIYLKMVSVVIHKYLMSLSMNEFISKYEKYFNLLPNEKLFPFFFEKQKRGESLSAFTFASARFERSLGDIASSYLSHAKSNIGVPVKLREYLELSVLPNILNKESIFVLRVFMGIPIGINVRNLVWHSFLTSKEYPTEYTSLLIMIMISISKLALPLLHPPHYRPLIKLDLYLYSNSNSNVTSCLFLENVTIDEFSTLFQRSSFVDSSRIDIWEESIKEYIKGNNYGFLIIILPQLEHSLRILFAHICEEPERLLSAESERVMTTLDTILSPSLEDGKINKLPLELGKQLMFVLLDLMEWKEGPRLRDRISHGLIDPSSISRSLTNQMLAAIVTLCSKYELSSYSEKSESETFPSFIQNSIDFIDSYDPVFHPKRIFEKAAKECLDHWRIYSHFVQMNPTAACGIAPNDKDHICEKIEEISEYIFSHYSLIPFFIESKETRTFSVPQFQLFCTPNELTKLGMLTRISQCCSNIMIHVMEKFQKYKETQEEMLSRSQQSNYQNIKENLHWFSFIVQTFMLVTEERFHSKDDNFEVIASLLLLLQMIESGVSNSYWGKAVEIFLAMCCNRSRDYFYSLSMGIHKKAQGKLLEYWDVYVVRQEKISTPKSVKLAKTPKLLLQHPFENKASYYIALKK